MLTRRVLSAWLRRPSGAAGSRPTGGRRRSKLSCERGRSGQNHDESARQPEAHRRDVGAERAAVMRTSTGEEARRQPVLVLRGTQMLGPG
jgi:hypothetical protein